MFIGAAITVIIFVLGTFSLGLNMKNFNTVSPNPIINEFKWGSTEPSVEIVLKSTMGYRALPISVDKAFNQ